MNIKFWKEKLGRNFGPLTTEFGFVLKKLVRNPLSLVGVAMLMLFIAIAVFAPLLAPPLPGKNPYEVQYYGPTWGWIIKPDPEPASPQHPFGLLDGYDIYYAVIWGTRTAFYTSSIVLALALLIGVFIGCIAGFYGGPVDGFLMRFTDIIFAFPALLLILILAVTLPPVWSVSLGPLHFTAAISYLDKLILAHVLIFWPSYARLTRGEVMKVKNDDFVESAKAIGCSNFRVMFRHILPNAVYPVLIMAFLGIGEIVLSFATLGFLGLGPEMGYRLAAASETFIPMYAEWGTIINHSRMWAAVYPYTLVIPGLFISCFILASTLMGDALGNILDPAIRRRLS